MPIGKLTEFNVRIGNWTLYIERAEMFFKMNEVKTDLWLPTLIAAMGDESYELLSNLTSPDLPSSKTYTEVVSVIKNHLQPKPSFISQRYHFRQRRQNAGESISQYISELKKMAKYCEFKTALEDNLRDQLICGLRSELIRQRLFAEENLVYGKAVTIACAMEAAEKDAAAVEQKTTGGVTDPGGGSETGSAASALNAVNAHSARRSGPGHWGHSELFSEGLGRFTGGVARLRVREGAVPVFCRARPVPYALRERLDDELEGMLRAGVIEPVESADWATPLVLVRKADNELRLQPD
ncbi:uncharacterized protein LOC125062003 [Pieris napi]|uniref:uncharacterized protein LOC125062003 n=1 Tax=Pieris napi TaxID=78633 RepID=UPI001FB87725|nr:uncharacterized protein LOC125062003 [Pieris napi]